MASTITTLPDHTQLPDKDGSFVRNTFEPPQSSLLTESIRPVLRDRHPDDFYFIGQDCGIYWRHIEPPDRGVKAPDWYYVPGVPALLNGEIRRSYVLWQELITPFVIIEYASGDGSEERDTTPWEGKFWIYEKVIRPSYYAIYEPEHGRLEVQHLLNGQFEAMTANEHGRFSLNGLGIELGTWQGRYDDQEAIWLRWWDAQGNLLPTLGEKERVGRERAEQRAEQAEQRAEQAQRLAEEERKSREQAQHRAEILAAKLKELGIEPPE